MKKSNIYSSLAIKAMQRASVEAMKQAAEKNLEVPIWVKGVVSYINPKTILTKQMHSDS